MCIDRHDQLQYIGHRLVEYHNKGYGVFFRPPYSPDANPAASDGICGKVTKPTMFPSPNPKGARIYI